MSEQSAAQPTGHLENWRLLSSGARLFGDGRILAQPPLAGNRPRFVVHPLLLEDVARWKAETSE